MRSPIAALAVYTPATRTVSVVPSAKPTSTGSPTATSWSRAQGSDTAMPSAPRSSSEPDVKPRSDTSASPAGSVIVGDWVAPSTRIEAKASGATASTAGSSPIRSASCGLSPLPAKAVASTTRSLVP